MSHTSDGERVTTTEVEPRASVPKRAHGVDVLRQIAVVVAAIAQIVANFALFGGDFGTQPPGAEPWENLATPAGYAFIVWGVIFLGSLWFATWHARPSLRGSAVLRPVGWLAAAGFALCVLWPAFASRGPLWGTIPTIVAMTLVLGAALVLAVRGRSEMSAWTRWSIITPLALFVGWLTAATFANTGDVLGEYGGPRLGLSLPAFGVVMVAGASCVALLLTWLCQARVVYVATVLWTLVAIAVGNADETLWAPVPVAALIGAAVLVVSAIVVRVPMRRRDDDEPITSQ